MSSGSSSYTTETHISSSRASSQSPTTSEPQSRSPSSAPEQEGATPRDHSSELSPPTYTTIPNEFSPGLATLSEPFKNPVSPRGFVPGATLPRRATLNLANSGAQHLSNSALYYSRRPAATNSIVVPNALGLSLTFSPIV
jgi:hypothetical protein